MAESNGVDHYDAHNVYQVGQVICRPVNRR